MKNIWWKIYYWCGLVLFVLAAIGVFIEPYSLIVNILIFVDLILSLIILYSFIYKRKILDTKIIQIYFWYSLAVVCATLVFNFSGISTESLPQAMKEYLSINQPEVPKNSIIIIYILSLPLIYAHYKVAFKEHEVFEKPTHQS